MPHYNPLTMIPEDDDPGVTCNHCGATDLHWGDFYDEGGNHKRVLFTERNRRHVCPLPDDFEDLT